jgi:tRNA(Ile)-lysidine synthase
MMFLDELQSTISAGKLFAAGETLLIGVSGGADSVALLEGLHCLVSVFNYNLMVAHLNHKIRGVTADEDAAFVDALCDRLGVPFFCETIDVPARAAADGISLEMAARTVRYEFFLRIAESSGADVIATAHTADDQAETILLKLTRGAGIDGLSGISLMSEMSGRKLIRPLLHITRRQITDFLTDNGIKWREDSSNTDIAFLRNRVRHELLPWLQKNLNFGIKDTLCRTAAILQDESIWLNELAEKLLNKCVGQDDSLYISALNEEPVAARRRVLRVWLSFKGIDIDSLSFQLIQRADELLCRCIDGSCSIELTGGYLLTRQYDKLMVEKSSDKVLYEPFEIQFSVPAEVILPEQSIKITASIDAGIIKQKNIGIGHFPVKASVSLNAVGNRELSVRSRRPGDRIKPLGIDGTQTLQDIFINEKVPQRDRESVPVIECDGEIIWIPGFRVARGWEVLPEDKESVHLCIERI